MTVYPWYNIFSWWLFIFILLQFAGVLPFSVMPSVILVAFGIICGFFVKLYLGKQMSISFIFIETFLHCVGFILLPLKFTHRDIIINVLLFISYCIISILRKINLFKLYNGMLHADQNVSFTEYLRQRGIL